MSNTEWITQLEIETLYEHIDSLNYYQMLCLSADCVLSDISPAYKRLGGRFHPDKLNTDDEELKSKSVYILLSFKEAHDTLLSMEGRLNYDALLVNGKIRNEDTQLNVDLDQGSKDPSQAATTDGGKKYWAMALEAFENKNFAGAKMQIDFALQYEPTNEVFLEWRDMVAEAAKKAPKQNNNPYKIRL